MYLKKIRHILFENKTIILDVYKILFFEVTFLINYKNFRKFQYIMCHAINKMR